MTVGELIKKLEKYSEMAKVRFMVPICFEGMTDDKEDNQFAGLEKFFVYDDSKLTRSINAPNTVINIQSSESILIKMKFNVA